MSNGPTNDHADLDDIKARLAAVAADLERASAATAGASNGRATLGEIADLRARVDVLTQQVRTFDKELDSYHELAERVKMFVTRVEGSWLFADSALKRAAWVWSHSLLFSVLLTIGVLMLLRLINVIGMPYLNWFVP